MPVSATLAPRSRLSIRLRVLTGLIETLLSPVRPARSKLDRRGTRVRGPNVGDQDGSCVCPLVCPLVGMAIGSAMVSRAGNVGERTGLPMEGGSPNDDESEGGGTDG